MGNKITVRTTPKNRISINTKGAAGGGNAIDTLRELRDVDASQLVTNETVVYDEVSGKFIVKELPIINGGTF